MITKKIAFIILIFAIMGLITASFVVNESDAATKKVESKKNIKLDKKIKILKTTNKYKIVRINGKNETLKRVKVYGKYTPNYAYMNKKYILITGARGTNGGSWKPAGTKVFENRVYSAKTKKAITNFGVIKINPKKKSDGEFTCYNPGTRYNDMDFCLQTGREKWYHQRYYLKILN